MTLRNLLTYWRHCLADGELSAPPWQKDPEAEIITFDQFLGGKIPSDLATQIVDQVEERLNRNRLRSSGGKEDQPETVTIESVEIAITPFRLQRIVEHSQRQEQDEKQYAPFWVAARLNREGSFLAPSGRAAWFVRDFLGQTRDNGITLGSLEEMDSFLSHSPAPRGETGTSGSWADLMEWVEDFFQAVASRSMRSFQIEGHATSNDVLFLSYSPQTGASIHLLKLYDLLLSRLDEDPKAEASTPLLNVLTRETAPKPVTSHLPLNASVRDEHLGQMTGQFGLGPSQRESLHALFQLPKNELIALNGPPGTGKTAWIQSAVASLWVQRALDGTEPPIIVATSTNNRAVTNILKTFKRATSSEAVGFSERWLPKIETYGLFLPSNKKSESTKHQWASKATFEWTGLPGLMENQNYLVESRVHYLQKANEQLKTEHTLVEPVLKALQSKLHATNEQIVTIRDAGNRLQAIRQSMPHEDLDTAYAGLADEELSAQTAVDKIEILAQEVDKAASKLTLLEELLAFLPPLRDRRNVHLTEIFKRHGLAEPILEEWRYRPTLEESIEEHRKAARIRLERAQKRLNAIEEWKNQEEEWLVHLETLAALLPEDTEATASATKEAVLAAIKDPMSVEPLLDRTFRHSLFLISARYWEGRWLLELKSLLEDSDPKKIHRQSKKDCLRRFERFAMVTPLFVSTAYMLPKFFDYFEDGSKPLIEGIDLLIVEEAGQVAPELGGGLLALAKRAVVLGDVFQIEPVWGISRAVDSANRKSHQAQAIRHEAFHSSRGSLMGIAQARTSYTMPGRSDGLWLREHRRCVPAVIAYCQELIPAYRAVLEPHRPEISERHLPALGWAHVRSDSSKFRGSWRNLGQAEAIASWIAERENELEHQYGQPIEKIVGIVTPYRVQVQSLNQSLAAFGFGSKIETGTVHTFQGGEFPLMIFSSVVGRNQAGPFFFDQSVNMLNVAVSRAQDSFLVFGDMKAFDPNSSNPSGVLARFLFTKESNQLPDVDSDPELLPLPGAERISGLEEHRRLLHQAFENAKENLLIVSPYLTERAVDAERLIDRIRKSKAQVSIAYSTDMAKPEARLVADRLEAAGAEIIRLRGFHTKTLAVDRSWFTHGSFNWLSAVREEGDRFQYREGTIRCGRPTAPGAIAEIWEEIEEGRHSA